MIRVDQGLCTGCGVCTGVCPSDAIALVGGVAVIDTERCDDCGECVAVCSNQALALITEPVPADVDAPTALVVRASPVERRPLPLYQTLSWRRVVLPAVGGALGWMGREVVPRLAPLALDVLDSVLERRLETRSGRRASPLAAQNGRPGTGVGRRRRWRRGRSRE